LRLSTNWRGPMSGDHANCTSDVIEDFWNFGRVVSVQGDVQYCAANSK